MSLRSRAPNSARQMESRKSRSGRAASIMVVLLLCASLLPPTTAQPWALVERTALLDFKDGDTGVNYYLSETPSALEQPALELWACVAPMLVRHSLSLTDTCLLASQGPGLRRRTLGQRRRLTAGA